MWMWTWREEIQCFLFWDLRVKRHPRENISQVVRRQGREQWRIRVQTTMKLNKNPQFLKRKTKFCPLSQSHAYFLQVWYSVNIQQVLPGRIRSDSANEQAWEKSHIKVRRNYRKEKAVKGRNKVKEHYRNQSNKVLRQGEWQLTWSPREASTLPYLAWLEIILHTVLETFSFGLQRCDYQTVANKMSRVTNSFASTKTVLIQEYKNSD